MDYFPIFLDLKNRPCTVVGGGEVASRKIALLLKAGAKVTVVAPGLCPALQALVETGDIAHKDEPYRDGALDGAHLVIAATDRREVNAEVSRAARAQLKPVNVVDDPELCSFIMPAIVDRSPVLIAASTGGASPVLARLIRSKLETLFPATYGELAKLAKKFRRQVIAALPEDARRPFWERALGGQIADLALSGRHDKAEAGLAAALRQAALGGSAPRGEVYIVGAGPGNPDLLTFAALRLMQQADVVLYDNLVPDAIVDLTRRDAERIYVGKKRAHHTMRQEEINALMLERARQGQRVLRLKGGDPYTFGRGGEEIELLAAGNIPFQVVPGVTAAAGVAAYAGIPLTHRDHAHACLLVTGNLKDGSLDLDWPAMVRPQQTLVIYMGLAGLPILSRQLVAHGMPGDTPAAVIQDGTLPRQKVITGTVADIPGRAAGQLKGPTLIIVGSVVTLREKLRWFD
ncbi:MAG: uroporphyrinogen-III C-methyltransferase [Betaproteobacteria bacterium]|nr:uroporphyrinogen-III C-methyltransferase [Betaproteobacteria bacterium]